jgi:hypothetical protein
MKTFPYVIFFDNQNLIVKSRPKPSRYSQAETGMSYGILRFIKQSGTDYINVVQLR